MAGETHSFGNGASTNSDAIITTITSDGNICSASHRTTGGTASSGGVTTAGGGATDSWAYGVSNAATGSSVAFTTTSSIICATWALPVELLSFKGKGYSSKVFLEWETASESNNDYFLIERNKTSGTGEWEIAGSIRGHGNSSIKSSYSFIDNDQNDTIYYRLKQVDFNGAYTYYGPIAVVINHDETNIYVNPESDQILINYSEKQENKLCVVNIYDITGRLCFSNSFLPSRYKKDMWIKFDESQGLYIIAVSTENTLITCTKIVKE
jgi:hypothetical protein